MTTSSNIESIASAIVKAQGEIGNVKKTETNPFFKSKYADLAGIWDEARSVLASNDLAVIQSPSAEGNKVKITTRLIHKSGEWIEDTLELQAVDSKPQSIGSAITYGRRYSLAAFLGIAQEDDDGNEASGKKEKEPSDELKQDCINQIRACRHLADLGALWGKFNLDYKGTEMLKELSKEKDAMKETLNVPVTEGAK